MIAWFSLAPGRVDAIGFTLGWLSGWVAFWRSRPLPRAAARSDRGAVAVIIPARNEERSIGSAAGGPTKGPLDEIVVVDDHSDDETTLRAIAVGARVVAAPDLPDGWLGKPAACRAGVDATDAPTLVFVDADVTSPPDLIDRLDAVVAAHPDSLVSVQPWHVPGSPSEQLSLPFNVVALMGSGGTALGHRTDPLAFGPVLACRRERYEASGGHGHPMVRSAVAEDVALGRAFGSVELFAGPSDVTFRMFPGGGCQVVNGWTKHIAVGARRTRPWLAVLSGAWVWSQLVGWAVSPWCYLAATLQLWVFARRVGRFAWWAIAIGPVLMLVFTVVVVRSAVLAALRRPVGWKGRQVRIG